ncbi:MAG TPA: POTRA domain-containing protein [Blastocatellia bacterium]|jgi:outer membrane protein insertion porin family|nr:POTRA domain-containing protein [Blastocatellia bacterium]
MIELLTLALSGILAAQTNSLSSSTISLQSFVEQQDEGRRTPQRRETILIEHTSWVEIEIVGARMISSQQLLAQMQLPRDPAQPDRLALQAPFYFDSLLDDLERVRYFLGSRGFLEAKIGEPKIENLGDHAKITVTIEEGLRYRIGNISVKGAKLFTPERIIEISGLRTGEIVNAWVISENVYKGIKEVYGDQGYIQADVEFIPNFRPIYPGAPEGIVDITLDIDEGRVFFISSVDFSGLVETDEQYLRDLLLVKEGDFCSRRMLVECLKRLNQLGLFEEIKEKDMIIRTNDKDQQVRLRIQVKEIKRQ